MMPETYKIIDTNTNSEFSAMFDQKETWNISIKKGKLFVSFDLNQKEAEQLYFLLVDTIGTPSKREIL